MRKATSALATILVMLAALPVGAAAPSETTYSVQLTVTSELHGAKIPLDPMIDFASLIQRAGARGVLDPNSIEVVDVKTGKAVRHALGEDFAYGDRGRVRWVIEDPSHKKYHIRFRTAAKRPLLLPRTYTPMIGTGDLIRYNADAPRQFAASVA